MQFEENVFRNTAVNLLWHSSHVFRDGDQASWSGFMQTYMTGDHPGKAQVLLLPIINLKPTDETCIYSTLLFVRSLSERYEMGTACITFDQPLWLKSVEIIQSKSLNVVCRIGGFHTIMSFLGSIGKMMAGTGLSNLLEMIYGENAVKHMMTGKAVSRELRGHFLIESVLTKKLLKILLPDAWVAESMEADLERGNEDEERQDAWVAESMEADLERGNDDEERQLIEMKREVTKDTLEEIEELFTSFIDGEVTIDDVSGSEAMQNLEICLQRCKDYLSSKSRTSKLWIQYLEYVSILKLFIYAERTGNWKLHLLANSQMLNLFSATGHGNYAKSSRLYLQLMLELPSSYPDIHEKFTNDGFSILLEDLIDFGVVYGQTLSLSKS